jgi:hypothetical protein
MIEPSFRTILLAAQPVRLLVDDRVYLGNAAQSERRPRIVLTLISRENAHCIDGAAGYGTGAMNVACLAPTYQGAKELADAARSALDCYVGLGVTSFVEIHWIEIESEEDIHVAPLEGQAVPTFGVSLTARFMFHKD